ncbi:methyltransferase [Streptomyces sp. NBC_00470]|uniref:methyltransferase n=1 Tax=Streptomyces sp. NBC_00470 TaxID=2975753 RepID=UPI002F91A171
MGRISKRQADRHYRAIDRARNAIAPFDHETRKALLEDFHEAETVTRARDGVFFTPWEMAEHFNLYTHGGRVLDLCAGSGRLATAHWIHRYTDIRLDSAAEEMPEIVCVEDNRDFVDFGQKVLPEATWIHGDVLDPAVWMRLGRFDYVIANPPYGTSIPRSHNGPRYRGPHFELHVLDVAATLSDRGLFLLPQGSTPFDPSGAGEAGSPYEVFRRQTGITLHSTNIDASAWRDEWHDASPATEFVRFNFADDQLQGTVTPEPFPLPRLALRTTPQPAKPLTLVGAIA